MAKTSTPLKPTRAALPVECGQGRCHNCAQSSIRTGHASWGPLGARLGPHDRALSCHNHPSTPLAPYANYEFATKSGNASHAALPCPLPPPKHMHHVWVRNGPWDHSVRPFRPNNTSPKTSQNRVLANFEPVRDVVSRLGFSTILPLQHHNTRQMGCPEVQNGRHASARRMSRVCSAWPDAGFQVPYP